MEDRESGRYFLNAFLKKIIWMILYTGVLTAGLYCLLAVSVRIWRNNGYQYCMLDCMKRLGGADVFAFLYLPLVLIPAGMDNRIYKQPAMLVQYGRLEDMWHRIFWELFWKSVVFSVIYSSICCILSGLSASEISNWHRITSGFYQETGCLYEGTVGKIFLLFFLMNMIKTLIVLTVLLLAGVSFKKLVLCLALLTADVILEWIYREMTLFFNLFSISFCNFKWNGTSYLLMICSLTLCAVVYILGKSHWKKREFYG